VLSYALIANNSDASFVTTNPRTTSTLKFVTLRDVFVSAV
jgi:hypothetical protein